MKNPFKKTELEKLTTTEETLFNVSISKLKTESISELKTRKENLDKAFKALKPLPMESPSEKAKRIQPYQHALNYLAQLIQQKEQEEKERRKERDEYVKTTAIKHLHGFRHSVENTNLLKSGMIGIPDVRWKTPTKPLLELETKSHRKVNFDLRKMDANTIKFLMNNPFHCAFYTVEGMAIKNGKQMRTLWQDKRFEEAIKVRPVADTILAIMYVG